MTVDSLAAVINNVKSLCTTTQFFPPCKMMIYYHCQNWHQHNQTEHFHIHHYKDSLVSPGLIPPFLILGNHYSPSLFCHCETIFINGIIQCVPFGNWIFSIQHKSLIIWSFTEVVLFINSPFLFYHWPVFHGRRCTRVCLLSHLLKDILNCFQFLIIMNKTFLYRFVCEYRISLLWDKCPEVQPLGCMVVECLAS